jgi:hypothetical protein
MPPITQHVYTGRDINMLDLAPVDVNIHDIAHSLAMQCRFGGHTKFHYSVAQHSVYVAERVFDVTKDPTRALLGLLHDGSEAYLTDLPRPVKRQPICAFYCAAERMAQKAVLTAFDLPLIDDELVKQVDEEILLMECHQLFDPPFTASSNLVATRGSVQWSCAIHKTSPEDAKLTFLLAFDTFEDMRCNA